MVDFVSSVAGQTLRAGFLRATLTGTEISSCPQRVPGDKTMQSAHEVAIPSIPGNRQVNGSESARTPVLGACRSAPLTNARVAPEWRDRIEVRVNEGDASDR
jgi:hypothetical protein